MRVFAGAGVLLVRALGALLKVEIELLGDFLRLGCRRNRDDDREVVAFREGDIRDENVAFLGKLHPGGVGAITTDDADLLSGDGLQVLVVVDGGDAHFAILGDEEL